MWWTERGSDVMNAPRSKGRYSRTFTSPTFSPFATSASTVSCAVSQPEPITMRTRSASGWPWYSNSRYLRPVIFAN